LSNAKITIRHNFCQLAKHNDKKRRDTKKQQSEKEEKKRLRMEGKENKDKNKLNKPIKRKQNRNLNGVFCN
jgi:hypothetical protein